MKLYKKIKQDVKYQVRNIIKGDKVIVLTGKDKGKVGTVLKVLSKVNRVIVERVNIVKKHMRATSAQNPGGIVEKEAPIHISNVALYCSKCAKGVRVGRKLNPDGKKIRYCKKCNQEMRLSSK